MEFRQLRRKAQALSAEECEDILLRGSHGVLAVLGDGGYPYAVPLSYVWKDGRIYLHCAKSGHKIDAIKACGRVSFCIVDRDEPRPEHFSTGYQSVIVFGSARIADDERELEAAVRALCKKYSPDEPASAVGGEYEAFRNALSVIVIEPEHISGKRSKD